MVRMETGWIEVFGRYIPLVFWDWDWVLAWDEKGLDRLGVIPRYLRFIFVSFFLFLHGNGNGE